MMTTWTCSGRCQHGYYLTFTSTVGKVWVIMGEPMVLPERMRGRVPSARVPGSYCAPLSFESHEAISHWDNLNADLLSRSVSPACPVLAHDELVGHLPAAPPGSRK